jgi:hypothetical protein
MTDVIQSGASVSSGSSAETQAPADTGALNESIAGAKSASGSSKSSESVESFDDFKARIAQEDKGGKGDEGEASTKPRTKSEEQRPKQDTDKQEDKAQEDKAQEGKILKLKVDGKEIELDLGNVEEVKRLAQMGLSSQKKFQEAAKVRSDAERFIKVLQDNPIELMKHPALREKMKEAAEEFLYEDIQRSQMSEEEIEAANMREELERYRRKDQERAQKEKQTRDQELQERYRADYERQFIDAIEGSGLPKTDWTIQRMAGYMRQALRQGLTNVTPRDVLALVKKDWAQTQTEMYSNLDGDKLIETLGAEVAEKIRRADVAKFKSGAQRPQHQSHDGYARTQPRRRFSSPQDMLEEL